MVAELFNAGDQVPVTDIVLVELVGKSKSVSPAQIAATCVNVGVAFGLTVMVIVVELAQSPAVGVKVYVIVA